ncbi:MAG: PQQ-binding-like beta-propeller repeat protein [Armatimonadota bacterium]|nr:PQQ-binding-like beta-propeller repeat protein [Armatimonadota bacterium]
MLKAIVWISAVVLFAADFGFCDWATLRGNLQRTGFVNTQIRPPFQLAWVRHFVNERIGTCVEPIVYDGKVFVATHNGSLYALSAETGEPIWRFKANGAFLHSPSCADGLVVAGSADGCLYAIDAQSGKLRWWLFVGVGGFSASPTIADSTVFIGSRLGDFVAVDLQTGKIRWRYSARAPIRQTASFFNGRVFVTAEDLRVRCFDAETGKLVWVSEPLNGQTARDYYPVIVQASNKTFVCVRTNPVREMGQHIGRDRQLLCQVAGIKEDWKAIEDWARSERAKGSPELWAKEQEAIVRYLSENHDAQNFFVLDAETGRELPPMPVLWVAGCQGVGTPPVVLPDGRLFVFYRSAYGNWNLGVAPLVALGLLDLKTSRITPLFHKHGMTPPWNTFWGTADESQNFVVTGDTVLIVHQGTLSGFNLSTGELFRIWGERDSWGGFRNLPWARNEWHGPARSGVAVVGNRIYWQTGSRVLCIFSGKNGQPAKDVGIDGSNVPTHHAPKLPAPSREQLRKQLALVVAEFLSRRWMPFCVEPGLAGREFAFDDSGEVFEALSWAYPHLPTDLQKKVKDFLAREWQIHPPFAKAAWYQLDEGEPREWSVFPKDLRKRTGADPQPHPFGNLYAVWIYASRCNEWEKVKAAWKEIRQCFDDFVRTGWRLNSERGDLFANRYLASLLAFQRMAEKFGDTEAKQRAQSLTEATQKAFLAWWRRSAEQVRLPIFRNIQEWDEFIGKGDALFFNIVPHKAKIALFHDLTPEVAEMVRNEAPEAAQKIWQTFELLCPTWNLVGEERQVHYGEHYVDPPDFALNAFRAFKWLHKATYEQLCSKLDIPICRADLSYAVKLALTLESK